MTKNGEITAALFDKHVSFMVSPNFRNFGVSLKSLSPSKSCRLDEGQSEPPDAIDEFAGCCKLFLSFLSDKKLVKLPLCSLKR